MSGNAHPNRRFLEETVRHLGALADDMVFLGGCAANLLITDPAASELRETYDVDVITEVAGYLQYHALGDRLRAQGFREDPGDGKTGVICRWRRGPLVLDVMPTDEQVLGFGNQWYAPAARAAMLFQLTPDRTIRLIAPAYFLATKLEAFDGRGGGDFLASHDIEDIVAVIDGRPTLPVEVSHADAPLHRYLAARFNALLETSDFVAAIAGHLPPDAISQQRTELIIQRIRQMTGAPTR